MGEPQQHIHAEGGNIFLDEELGAIAVSDVVSGLIDDRTGFPITPERELVDADGVRTGEKVQFFESAVITVRNGAGRVWFTDADAKS